MKRLFYVFISVSLLFSCTNEEPKQFKLTGNALGTTYHITYIGEELAHFENKVDSMIAVINHSLSTYDEHSFISAFNATRNKMEDSLYKSRFGKADLYLFDKMVRMSTQISEKTDGAFDPSAALLFQEYSRAKSEGVVMNDSVVKHSLLHQGMSYIQWDENNYPLKTDSLVQLNFNAIAKGYLVDIIADFISANGLSRYMVEIGGEMRLGGLNFEDSPWRVGINTPLLAAKSQDFFEVLELKNKAIATSGNYQNYYMVNDSLVGHTLNPSLGIPVIHNLKSVSIIHEQCAVADAMATACMVVGLERAREFISADTSLQAYFIYEEDERLIGELME